MAYMLLTYAHHAAQACHKGEGHTVTSDTLGQALASLEDTRRNFPDFPRLGQDIAVIVAELELRKVSPARIDWDPTYSPND